MYPNGPFGNMMPYSNFHGMNLDWVIQIAKDFLDQYTHIQEIISTGETSLEEKAAQLEGLLQQWYDTHSNDIAQQLADALTDIGNTLQDAIGTFSTRAAAIGQEVINSIPEDYTALTAEVSEIQAENQFNYDSVEMLLNEIRTISNLVYSAPYAIATGTATTWNRVSLGIHNIPSGARFIYSEISSVEYDGTTAPTYLLVFVFKDASSADVGSYNQTVLRATFNIPAGAVKAEIFAYVNGSVATNTRVVYNHVVISTDGDPKISINDDVMIGESSVEDLSDMEQKLLPVKNIIGPSKNIFTSVFARGTINATTGIYGPTPQGLHNSATPDLMPVLSRYMYTLSWDWNENITALYLFEYTSDGTFITRTVLSNWVRRIRYISFITSPTTAFVRFMVYEANNTEYAVIVPQNVQLELGGISTPTMATMDLSPLVDFTKVQDASLVVPDYYFEEGYLQNKVNTIRQLMVDADGNYDAFIFVTDTHWEINQQHSPALIRYIKQALNINTIIHGGDMYDKWSEFFHDEVLKKYELAFGSFPYCVAGNHEYKGSYMTDATIWYFLNSPHKDIVPGNPARNYYYVDNLTTKTRLVVLNVLASDDNDDATFSFEEAQQLWLANTALDVPAGWRIVIAAHALYNIYEGSLVEIPDVTQNLINIVDNYQGNGYITCIIQGHIHIDRITFTPGGIPIIATTCDKNGIWVNPDTHEGDLDYVTRTTGTIDEQAFDIFVLDYKNRIITAERIGSQAFDGTGDNQGTQVEHRQINMH